MAEIKPNQIKEDHWYLIEIAYGEKFKMRCDGISATNEKGQPELWLMNNGRSGCYEAEISQFLREV